MDGGIYLLGPSSGGKSNAVRYAATELGAQIVDVDVELRSAPRPWRGALVLPVLERAELADELVLIDIGAGAQADAVPDLGRYLAERANRTVLVIPSPHEAWLRNEENHVAGHARTFEDYMRDEFWSRAQLYAVAGRALDVSNMSAEVAGRQFLDMAREIIQAG